MSSDASVDAAMRVVTALALGGAADADAELFARTITQGADELPRGFEELCAGLLEVVMALLVIAETATGLHRARLVRAAATMVASARSD
ncbi:hypothetical protein [Nocardioides humi]|uniref:Uncharacterized protein n=1 Tax=Nocardioides humi TaxID=449461 RepID=A0ABN2BTQ2_9ACTN|nr:hypothetical protein [Nocardioides humi]